MFLQVSVCPWGGGMCGRGCAWCGACVVGGMCGRGVCMAGDCVWQGGMCSRGHACHTCPPPWQILWLWHTVNERAVRILQECNSFFIFYLIPQRIPWAHIVNSYRLSQQLQGIRTLIILTANSPICK